MTRAGITGLFRWTCKGPDGRTKWRDTFPNGTTVEGVNAVLNQVFAGGPTGVWYMGLIDESGYTGLSTSDTHASHSGWSEWTFYTGNRPAWNTQAAAGGVLSTLLASQWVMTASGQLRGAFLANTATKGTAAGPVLYAQAAASSARTVAVSDTISVTYVVRILEP